MNRWGLFRVGSLLELEHRLDALLEVVAEEIARIRIRIRARIQLPRDSIVRRLARRLCVVKMGESSELCQTAERFIIRKSEGENSQENCKFALFSSDTR